MSKFFRSVENAVKGYSLVEVKVREGAYIRLRVSPRHLTNQATTNEFRGPSSSQMAKIAEITFNNSQDFYAVVDMLDLRLKSKAKDWRQILKALKVLDYCNHKVSKLVLVWTRKNIKNVIEPLKDFIFEEGGVDVGHYGNQSLPSLFRR